MNTPLTTVIMPAYNAEVFLREAIDSILNQTYKNFELLIVNDGSTDSTKEIILSYTDPRVRYLENEVNMGIIRTKNKAIDEARGKYIATLDADDVAVPDRLEKQVNFMEANPDYGLCGTLHEEIDATGKKLLKSNFPVTNKDIQSYLAFGNCFCHSSTLVNGKLMKELKYAEAFEVAEDYEMWYRISRRYKVVNLPETLVLYRVHGNNISITKKEKMFDTVKRLARRILTDAEIGFDEQELEIHSKMLSFSSDYFQDKARFAALEAWLTKLYSGLKAKKIYNNSLLFTMLAERWMVVCTNTKRYNKLIFNKLSGSDAAGYYSVLARKVLHIPVKY